MREDGRPEAALFLNTGDSVRPLGRFDTGSAMRPLACECFAVVHRGAETFTHLYLVPALCVRARREVRLAAVFPGDAAAAAERWLRRRFAASISEAAERLAA